MESLPTKASILLVSVAVASGILLSHVNRDIFPWLPLSFGASALVLLIAGSGWRLPRTWWIGLAVTVGVWYRAWVFVWPASMVGLDPDKVAVAVNRIVDSGQVSSIAKLSFYSKSPLAHLYAAETSLITGLPAQQSLIVYAITLGLVLPLVAAALARRFSDSSSVATVAMGIAATLVAVATNGVMFAYWPLPQSISVLYWACFLLTIVLYYHLASGARRWLFVPSLVGLLFSHKLGLFLALATLVAAVLVRLLNRVQVGGWGHATDYYKRERGWRVALLVGLALAIQWVFLTEWIKAVVLSALLPLLSPSLVAAASQPAFANAVPVTSGIMDALAKNVNWLVLLPAGNLAAAVLWKWDDSIEATILLGATAICSTLVGLSLVSAGGAATNRSLFFAEIVLSVPIAVVAGRRLARSSRMTTAGSISARSVVVLLLSALIVAQVGGAGAAPDYPGEPRFYLTAGEVEAKEFASARIMSTTYADPFYASEIVSFERSNLPYRTGSGLSPPGFDTSSRLFLNGTATDWSDANSSVDSYFAYRRSIAVLRSGFGLYKLQESLEPELGLKANRVYSNGEVVIFGR